MKVLALVTDAFGGYGGIAQYNRDFLTALADASAVGRVRVLPRIAPEPVGDLPANVRQDAPVRDKLRYSARALRAARAMRPDLIFSGHLYHGPLAALLARMTGARLVSQLHGTEVWTPLQKNHRKALLASDLVLTVSRDTFARLRDQIVETGRTGAVLANTVQPVFRPGDREAARARFGLTPDASVLLSVGRLDTRDGYKGHDRIIEMMPRLRAEGRNVVYLVAGVGSDRVRLEYMAIERNISSRVRFLGMTPYEDLPDLYRAADLFVLPSTGEGFGIVYLEAMACGTPALGLRVGGAPDPLGDGELGWCVNADDLADAVRRALDAPRPDAQTLYNTVQARFGMDVFRRRVARFMERLH